MRRMPKRTVLNIIIFLIKKNENEKVKLNIKIDEYFNLFEILY